MTQLDTIINKIKLFLCKDELLQLNACQLENKNILAANSHLIEQLGEKNKLIDNLIQLSEEQRKIKEDGVPLPMYKEPIQYNKVKSILKRIAPNVQIYLSDNLFYTLDIDEFKKFLAYDDTNYNVYVTETFDCDNFSFRLIGNTNVGGWSDVAIFICWSDTHAFNLVIDSDSQVWIVEPQTDYVVKYDQNVESMYKNIRVIMG